MIGRSVPAVSYALAGLLGLVGLGALGGGSYGLVGAKGIPTAWLAHSPFTSYLVPSLILFFVVGGSLLGASVAVLRKRRLARAAAITAGVILLGWIGIQVSIIGYVSWLQPTVAALGALILALAARL
jgi:hypothetical protein